MPVIHISSQERGVVCFWCPGCNRAHCVETDTEYPDDGGRVWHWNKDMDRPTFTPSLNYPGVCHSIVEHGKIFFCHDSAHALSGKQVHLPEWPTR